MTSARPPRGAPQADDRVLAALGRIGDRLDSAVERIDERLESIDRRQAGQEQDTRALRTELVEVRRDLADARDLTRLEGTRTRDGQVAATSNAAASGAAQGAMSAFKSLSGWQVGTALMMVLTFVVTLLTQGATLLKVFLKLMGAADVGPVE